MIIALVDPDWRRQFFYLDSAAEVHICLMHTTKKIHHPDHTKLKVLGKGIVTLLNVLSSNFLHGRIGEVTWCGLILLGLPLSISQII